MSASVRQIAARAGVSHTTAWRALKRMDCVDPVTSERVWAAANWLGGWDPDGRVTQADLAALLGLHPQTVCRALSGDPGRRDLVSVATVARVRAAVTAFDYHPRQTAGVALRGVA